MIAQAQRWEESIGEISIVMSPSKTFSDYLRLWFKWVLDPLGGFFNSLGLTPNMMTILGLIGNSVGAYYLAIGHMLTGGLLVLLMTPIGALDGAVARLRGGCSDLGAVGGWVSGG